MKKIFLIYGHYDDKSFNAAIRDTFIKTAKEKGHSVDAIDLYKEKFDPVFAGEEPDKIVLDHRKRIEISDTIVLIAPIWNFRMPAIVEGWIDKVLAPPWWCQNFIYPSLDYCWHSKIPNRCNQNYRVTNFNSFSMIQNNFIRFFSCKNWIKFFFI